MAETRRSAGGPGGRPPSAPGVPAGPAVEEVGDASAALGAGLDAAEDRAAVDHHHRGLGIGGLRRVHPEAPEDARPAAAQGDVLGDADLDGAEDGDDVDGGEALGEERLGEVDLDRAEEENALVRGPIRRRPRRAPPVNSATSRSSPPAGPAAPGTGSARSPAGAFRRAPAARPGPVSGARTAGADRAERGPGRFRGCSRGSTAPA